MIYIRELEKLNLSKIEALAIIIFLVTVSGD